MTAALYMEFEAENTDDAAYARELSKQAEIIKLHAAQLVATKNKLEAK